MSVALDAGKKLPPALLNWIRKRAGVDGIGLEERLLLEARTFLFIPPLNTLHFRPPNFFILSNPQSAIGNPHFGKPLDNHLAEL